MIEIDGAEAPIMDGSAAAFVAAIDQAGIVALPAARRYTKVLKPIRVQKGDAYGELTPYDRGFRVDVDDRLRSSADRRAVLRARRRADARSAARSRARAPSASCATCRKLWSAGYALGASLENTLVVADDRLLNPEGLRYADEFVRHKALDAIGDLALAGAPLLGAYRSVRGGHRLNHAILTRADGRSDRLDGGRGERGPGRAGAAPRPCGYRRRAGCRPIAPTCPERH